ncbi:hypothetical protein G9465_19290 (plasmid) [Haloarcula sp. JP-L23]|nr:hypothetical protein G9465_19290 [Haloarcula sp. JP-L23]
MINNLGETYKKAVLNETTNTVHKPKTGGSDFQTDCGVSRHLGRDQLRIITVEQAIDSTEISKCGRCFADVGGY